ncbi:MAG: hypothetical protein ACFFA6_17200 [Promethearchaeota archaeon]
MAKDDLTTRQRKFITALLTARTVAEAAQTAGVCERTGLRYLADSRVKRALTEALDNAMDQATRRVVNAMTAALETLEAVHQDPDATPSARVSAARAILDAGPKLREALDLAERVTELEKQLHRVAE